MNLKEFTQSDTAKLEDGIIRGVHILGLKSKNRREYTPAAVEKARSLYEGASVFVDHDPKAARVAGDAFGILEGVTFGKDGLRGDLKFLATHPMAARVQEDIKRDLRLFGLSHNVDGKGTKNDRGILIVESIEKVNSVDLVTGAATVSGLLESIQPDDEPDATIALTEQVSALTEQLTASTAEVATLKSDLAKAKKLLRPVSVGITEQTLKDPAELGKWLTSK